MSEAKTLCLLSGKATTIPSVQATTIPSVQALKAEGDGVGDGEGLDSPLGRVQMN